MPAPATSLSLYRNGVLQKPSLDYTATGNSIQFIAASTPQPGDTLLASYRTEDSSGGVTTSFSGYSTPQVLCSGTGGTVNSAALVSLGTCAIPAGVLSQGDRIEIRFDYAHGGTAGGFSIETHWGGTTIVHRDAASTETLPRRARGCRRAGGERTVEFGNVGDSAGVFGQCGGGGRRVRQWLDDQFSGLVANGGDSLTLSNFAVVRIPEEGD